MLRAYRVSDNEIYAAESIEQAAELYRADTGEECESPYFPEAISDAELDGEIREYDEDERPTGDTTTIRAWLLAATEPGWLAGTVG